MAAEAERAFGGFAGPNRLQINTHWRKNGHMKNGQDAFGKGFGLFELKCHAAEAKIEYARTAGALIANDGVGVGASH